MQDIQGIVHVHIAGIVSDRTMRGIGEVDTDISCTASQRSRLSSWISGYIARILREACTNCKSWITRTDRTLCAGLLQILTTTRSGLAIRVRAAHGRHRGTLWVHMASSQNSEHHVTAMLCPKGSLDTTRATVMVTTKCDDRPFRRGTELRMFSACCVFQPFEIPLAQVTARYVTMMI